MNILSRVASGVARVFARRTVETRDPTESRAPFTRPLSGVRVTPDTAITVAAVWACLRYLSQTVAVLPWRVMLDDEKGPVVQATHHVDKLLHVAPNPEWTPFQWVETLVHWALRYGNGYAEIARDSIGRPTALWPLHPDRVEAERDEQGNLVYRISNGTAPDTILAAADMFHIRGFGDGVVGVNVMEYAAESIGWAKAAQMFGAAFFGNGMNVAAVIESDKPVGEKAMLRVLAGFKKLYGGVRNAGKSLMLDSGMKFKQVQIDPEKGQFLATNQHLIEEVCRWFGVPPHKIAHLLRATFSNIEHQGIEVVVDSITPWAVRLEQEANRKLFNLNRPGYYTKLNLNALLRGDTTARAAWYKAMREAGVYSANDILRREDEPTIGAAGDKRVIQANYTTLEKVGEQPLALPAPRQQPAEEDEAPDDVAALLELERIHAA